MSDAEFILANMQADVDPREIRAEVRTAGEPIPSGDALKAQALAGRADRDALTLEVEEMELEHVKHLLRREQRDTSGDEEAVRGRLIELLLEEPRE